MESHKQQYFQYLQRPPPQRQTYSQHHNKRSHPKILPHIAEEYDFRTTNQLLLNKIIHPKRDKTIIQSIASISRKYANQRSSPSRKRWRSGIRQRQGAGKENESGSLQTKQKFIRRQRTSQSMIVGRKKVGINITMIKSLQNQSVDHIGVFQNRIRQEEEDGSQGGQTKQQSVLGITNSVAEHSITPKHNTNFILHKSGLKNILQKKNQLAYDTFGNGPTIIFLTHISLDINPPIKPQTLIILELIERIRSKDPKVTSIGQRIVKSDPIPFRNLPNKNGQPGIKFAVKISKIGDFVPLRICRYWGLQCLEIGTTDLPLSVYRQNDEDKSDQNQEIKQQFSREGLSREVIQGFFQGRLRKGNCIQLESRVRLGYRIYPKRFRR